MTNTILLVFELIGTVAFAASGAIVALSKKMDIFGVVTLGVVTAVGGGVIRDLVLGHTPPATFQNPLYALVAIGKHLQANKCWSWQLGVCVGKESHVGGILTSFATQSNWLI